MDSRKLQYFVEVAAASSFSKAAEKLLVAQPAISRSIQKLEEELQLQLFDRSEKAAVLTREGRALLAHAHAILERMKDAEREMEELRGLQRGEIRFGLPSMFGSVRFPAIMKAFKNLYPALTITVVEEGTVQIRSLIERREVDLGVVSMETEDPEIVVTPLATDEMVACLAIEHPLSDRDFVTLSELLNEPLVLFKEGYFQRQLLMEAGKEAQIEPNIVFSTNQLSLIRSLVVEGVGVTLFLRMVAESDPMLRAIPLKPPVPVHLGIGRRKHAQLSKASQTFLDFLQRKMSGQPIRSGNDIMRKRY